MAENYGGQAFPVMALEGMSLRDYFAGQALAGLCTLQGGLIIGGKSVTIEEAAYLAADAMLKERQK